MPRAFSIRAIMTLNYRSPSGEYRSRYDDPLPAALVVVAWLFIGFGVWTIILMVAEWTHNGMSFNLMCLGVFVGPGLLRLKRGWRIVALVLLWMTIIGQPLLLLAMLGGAPYRFHLLGRPATVTESVIIQSVTYVGAIWCYLILIRRDICRRFWLF
jgi:hypothetical protein